MAEIEEEWSQEMAEEENCVTSWNKGRVSQVGSTGGGTIQCKQNGQKLHENYKINIFGSTWGGDMGEQANFLSSAGGFPQSFFSLRFFILLRMCSESNKSEHLLKCNRLHYIAILSKS